ncbi:MAG: OmpA family protein [Schleiferiaceae bacterium]
MGWSQSNKARRLYRDAQELARQRNFPEVIVKLKKAIKDSPEYVDAYIFLGDVFLAQEEYSKASTNYQLALDNKGSDYIYFKLALSEFNSGKYQAAAVAGNKYLTYQRARDANKAEINRLLTNCEFAQKAIANPVPFSPEPLPFNTDAMEYFPSISGDGSKMVYTRRDPDGRKRDEDFFSAELTDTGWTEGARLVGQLNSPANEGAQSLSADGRFLFFAGCERYDGMGSCDIYMSYRKRDGSWSAPKNLGDSINSRAWESQPSISADGKTLYFARGQNGRSQNVNIMISHLKQNGTWTKAKLLDGPINNKYKQESPFIHFDNQTLYFISDGHPGMGGKDIYLSRKQEDGSWGEPENLGYPINTYRDEFSLIVGPNGYQAYFASDRLAAEGGNNNYYDLFSFELPIAVRATPIAWIEGYVFDIETEKPLSAGVEIFNLSTGQVTTQIQSFKNGTFSAALPAGSDYSMEVKKAGYTLYSQNFSLAKSDEIAPQKIESPLSPIKIDAEFALNNILFESNSYKLLEISQHELGTLIEFLELNPTVEIEIQGHTDNVGTPESNLILSSQRATSVAEFLIEKGIGKDRIQAIGLGEDQPVASNETEEGRRLNRRTQIRITNL